MREEGQKARGRGEGEANDVEIARVPVVRAELGESVEFGLGDSTDLESGFGELLQVVSELARMHGGAETTYGNDGRGATSQRLLEVELACGERRDWRKHE